MEITTDLREAVDALRKGHTLLFYSDVGWVIGGDATRPETVSRLVHTISPTVQNPCTILINEIGQLQQFVQKVPEIAWDLVEFAENPLTIVYPTGKNVAPEALTADGRIAIRLVRKETSTAGDGQSLVSRFGRGLATIALGTSATTDITNLAALAPEADFLFQQSAEKRAGRLPTVVQLELDGQIVFIRK